MQARRAWVLSVNGKRIKCNYGILQMEKQHHGIVASEAQRKAFHTDVAIWRHMGEGRGEGGLREVCDKLRRRVGLGLFSSTGTSQRHKRPA